MPSINIRNLPEATHRALKLRAAQHGRSTEAEVRFILEAAVAPKVGLGCALAEIGRTLHGGEIDLLLDLKRDPRPVKSARFE
jgi:antitoxin FitA